jgi:hypothetical protein
MAVPADSERDGGPGRLPVGPDLDMSQVEGVEDQLDVPPGQPRVDLVGVAVQGRRAVFAALRPCDHKNASRSLPGSGSWTARSAGASLAQRALGASPVSEWTPDLLHAQGVVAHQPPRPEPHGKPRAHRQ